MNKDDLTHNSFEEQWQKAFEDASLTPPEGLWEKVELGLEQTSPPKSDNRFYYLGGVGLLLLGVLLWVLNQPKTVREETKAIEKQPIVVDTKLPLKETEKPITEVAKTKVLKNQGLMAIQKKEATEQEGLSPIPEESIERILIDTVDYIMPIPPKEIKADFKTITPELPAKQIPYYEKPKPKPEKKSIFNKIRVSGGIGVYQ